LFSFAFSSFSRLPVRVFRRSTSSLVMAQLVPLGQLTTPLAETGDGLRPERENPLFPSHTHTLRLVCTLIILFLYKCSKNIMITYSNIIPHHLFFPASV
jgi:hypothetical protein